MIQSDKSLKFQFPCGIPLKNPWMIPYDSHKKEPFPIGHSVGDVSLPNDHPLAHPLGFPLSWDAWSHHRPWRCPAWENPLGDFWFYLLAWAKWWVLKNRQNSHGGIWLGWWVTTVKFMMVFANKPWWVDEQNFDDFLPAKRWCKLTSMFDGWTSSNQDFAGIFEFKTCQLRWWKFYCLQCY